MAAQLSTAFAQVQEGIFPSDNHIELISLNPRVATYSTYHPGFLTAGMTRLIVLDETGRFPNLAPHGRVKELASSEQSKARNYKAYCRLAVTHWIGPYYSAVSDDFDDC